MTDHAAAVAGWQARFEEVLDHYLPPTDREPRALHRAMRYSTLDGGKRIRPVLVYATGKTLGLAVDQLDPIAAAIE